MPAPLDNPARAALLVVDVQRGLDDVELATLEYVDWFNHRRLHSHCGDIPPVELEHDYYRQTASLDEDQPATASLH